MIFYIFTDEIDEFVIRILMKYKEKEFKSVSSGDLGIDVEENQEQTESEKNENKELI